MRFCRLYESSIKYTIPEDARKETSRRYKESKVDKKVFDKAQDAVWKAISETFYPNFIRSELYVEYVQSCHEGEVSIVFQLSFNFFNKNQIILKLMKFLLFILIFFFSASGLRWWVLESRCLDLRWHVVTSNFTRRHGVRRWHGATLDARGGDSSWI